MICSNVDHWCQAGVIGSNVPWLDCPAQCYNMGHNGHGIHLYPYGYLINILGDILTRGLSVLVHMYPYGYLINILGDILTRALSVLVHLLCDVHVDVINRGLSR